MTFGQCKANALGFGFSAVGAGPAIEHLIWAPRLFMRPVSAADRDYYIELFTNQQVMEFIGLDTGTIPSIDEIDELLNGAIEGWNKRGWGRWTIFNHAGEFIGLSGFRSEDGVPDLITAILPAFWDSGISMEAAAACIEYGRKAFGFSDIVAFTHPNNARARRVLDKMGASFEGDVPFHGVIASKYSLP